MNNDHGLSRSIPSAIKREVRQRSRFGCVICRGALVQYEHIQPEWHEAKMHDPSAICLLCPKHHQLVTSGRLPKAEVLKAYAAIQSSESPAPPRDDEFFTLYQANASFVLGSCSFEYLATLIEVDGKAVLRYQPVDDVPPFVIEASIRGRDGEPLFTIAQNEWIGPTDKWDVEQSGSRLLIREGAGRVLFEAEKDSTANTMAIRRLDMWWPPFHILLAPSLLEVGQYAADMSHGFYLGFHDWHFKGVTAALSLSTAAGDPKPTHVDVIGDVGARLRGTGITIGASFGQALAIGSMSARMVGKV